MRCPKCSTETPTEAMQCPGCNSLTPRGRVATKQADEMNKKLQAEKRKQKKYFTWKSNQKTVNWKSINWRNWRSIPWQKLIPSWLPWAIVGLFLVVGGFFGYRYIYQSQEQESVSAKTAVGVMNQLRSLPSNKTGMNLDQCLMDEIKKSRENGQLVNYTGWTIKSPNPNQYLISFSFEERNGVKSAEWLVDASHSSFMPQSELAIALHKQ
jgi:hypothetical protein